MNREEQAIWLSEHELCSLQHLVEVSGLSVEELEDLMATGVIASHDERQDDLQVPVFALHTVVIATQARRLRDDFELEPHGVALAMRLLQRMHALETEIADLRARLGQRPPRAR